MELRRASTADFGSDLPAPLGAPHRPELAKYCRIEPLTLKELKEVKALLEEKGTLNTDKGKCIDAAGKPTGMFSAAASNVKGCQKGTGYYASWIRDNCLVSFDLYHCDPDGAGGADAVACINAIANFLLKYAFRIERVIGGQENVKGGEEVWMQRPHIRFDGSTLLEIPERYNHKQNDALGYFIWMRCLLAFEDKFPLSGSHLKLLGQLFDYLRTIECWQDEDGGHWEEHSKIEASSLGPVLAGIRLFKKIMKKNKGLVVPCQHDTLDVLQSKIEAALAEILPNECIQPHMPRDADGALIFLCYPLEVVDEAMAAKILQNVSKKITNEIGINRYAFDSYFCKDYKDYAPGAEATKHYTDEELKERDKLVKHGEEAQWCIFDPMVSAYYGKLYHKHKKPEHLRLQQLYLSRSLAHISGDDCIFGAWECPELYYIVKGKWRPCDQTPLLWTIANLKVALQMMEQSLSSAPAKGARKRPASKISK